MFSKEESRRIRQEFWTSFGKSFPRKWILYNTKLKGLSFKFHFDTKNALVALELEDPLEKRIAYWDKLTGLKSILKEDYLPNAIYDEICLLDNGKEISRIYVPLENKVSIHNKNSWQEVMLFFNNTMGLFEAFFVAYKEVIEG
ncbi:DUF4268 domain-containing protein [Aestuariivivens sediminis]|uniref:DUF4268 domain-containing protein n=1 Tax=Aestuariivivens sediminis TaxID=2913557 RepID=UPI001F5849BE|nr:DUF4268 domain-containing protein [Aestuariivivens sediminis]